MQSAKQDTLNAINRLPNDANMDDILYCLYVLNTVRKGQKDVELGRVTDVETLKREIEQW